ncbi:hypothetical protein V7122_14020 [Bacillus sp. JJ1532]|uniref:hypothetical protein n=1 Tax=Bacillus sp. JJ1532 TaxID=3122958 RepID=UPI002FFF936C
MILNYKRALGYLAYSVGFILLLVIISNINSHFIKMINETYRMYPWQILISLMYFPIGIYLGIPNILKEFNKTGRWRINYYKIVLVALPMIYLSFYWFFPFSYPIPDILAYTKTAFSFGTIIVGFFIINSFTKE